MSNSSFLHPGVSVSKSSLAVLTRTSTVPADTLWNFAMVYDVLSLVFLDHDMEDLERRVRYVGFQSRSKYVL